MALRKYLEKEVEKCIKKTRVKHSFQDFIKCILKGLSYKPYTCNFPNLKPVYLYLVPNVKSS